MKAFMSVAHAIARRHQRGQSSIEYLVALALVTALVAVPIDGNPSVIEMLIAAIRTAFARLLGALSLPM